MISYLNERAGAGRAQIEHEGESEVRRRGRDTTQICMHRRAPARSRPGVGVCEPDYPIAVFGLVHEYGRLRPIVCAQEWKAEVGAYMYVPLASTQRVFVGVRARDRWGLGGEREFKAAPRSAHICPPVANHAPAQLFANIRS